MRPSEVVLLCGFGWTRHAVYINCVSCMFCGYAGGEGITRGCDSGGLGDGGWMFFVIREKHPCFVSAWVLWLYIDWL